MSSVLAIFGLGREGIAFVRDFITLIPDNVSIVLLDPNIQICNILKEEILSKCEISIESRQFDELDFKTSFKGCDIILNFSIHDQFENLIQYCCDKKISLLNFYFSSNLEELVMTYSDKVKAAGIVIMPYCMTDLILLSLGKYFTENEMLKDPEIKSVWIQATTPMPGFIPPYGKLDEIIDKISAKSFSLLMDVSNHFDNHFYVSFERIVQRKFEHGFKIPKFQNWFWYIYFYFVLLLIVVFPWFFKVVAQYISRGMDHYRFDFTGSTQIVGKGEQRLTTSFWTNRSTFTRIQSCLILQFLGKKPQGGIHQADVFGSLLIDALTYHEYLFRSQGKTFNRDPKDVANDFIKRHVYMK